METVLIRERYKVVRVLETAQDYIFAEAVDITERETPIRFVNLYEGKYLSAYARIFSGLHDCDAFCETFLTEQSLAAVFRSCGGDPIDHVLYRGASFSWQDRLVLAEQILHQALKMANLPPEISCAAMLSDNVRIDLGKKSAALRFCIRPMEEMNARELALLASDQVRKALLPRFQQGDVEYAFCQQLAQGEFLSIVPLYAAWRRAVGEITEEYEKLYKQNGLKRWLIFLWKNLKRYFKKHRNRG